MNIQDTINNFVEKFSELNPKSQEHIEFNDELLPHVFFGDCDDFFINLIIENNPERLNKLFNLIEEMASYGTNTLGNC
jgi:hypothetical protein